MMNEKPQLSENQNVALADTTTAGITVATMAVLTSYLDIEALRQFGWAFIPFFLLFVILQGFVIAYYARTFRTICAAANDHGTTLIRAYKLSFYLLTLTTSAAAIVGIALIRYVGAVKPH